MKAKYIKICPEREILCNPYQTISTKPISYLERELGRTAFVSTAGRGTKAHS